MDKSKFRVWDENLVMVYMFLAVAFGVFVGCGLSLHDHKCESHEFTLENGTENNILFENGYYLRPEESITFLDCSVELKIVDKK